MTARQRWTWHDGPDLKRGNPPVVCAHCGKEIGAAATDQRSLSVNGVYGHIWNHVDTGWPTCEVAPPVARPVDPFIAQRAIDTPRPVADNR